MCFSRSVCSMLLLMPGMLGLAVNVGAQTKSRVSGLRELNNKILRVHEQMQQASPAQAEAIRTEARTAIAERASALNAVMEENPAEAMSFAFSPELSADLAAKFPDSASQLETYGSWEGAAERWVVD